MMSKVTESDERRWTFASGTHVGTTLQYVFWSEFKKWCRATSRGSFWSNAIKLFLSKMKKVLWCCIRELTLEQNYSTLFDQGAKSAAMLHLVTHFGTTLQHIFWSSCKKCCSAASGDSFWAALRLFLGGHHDVKRAVVLHLGTHFGATLQHFLASGNKK